jgi:hypothetical protein
MSPELGHSPFEGGTAELPPLGAALYDVPARARARQSLTIEQLTSSRSMKWSGYDLRFPQMHNYG